VLAEAVADFRDQGVQADWKIADIREPLAVEALVDTVLENYGGLDILINNAAGNFPARIEDLSYNAFKTVVDIDLQGTFNVSKAVFTRVMKAKGGAIVNIAAPFEHVGVAWQAHAAAAKSGVLSLTRTAAVEWGKLGIRVNAVSPGEIQSTEGSDRLADQLTRSGQSRRVGTAIDVADAVVFLCSDAAQFISGQHLCVDGGSGVDLLKVDVYPDNSSQ
jgi:peroxisomal 2,4-dienoyl-CoA reductase